MRSILCVSILQSPLALEDNALLQTENNGPHYRQQGGDRIRCPRWRICSHPWNINDALLSAVVSLRLLKFGTCIWRLVLTCKVLYTLISSIRSSTRTSTTRRYSVSPKVRSRLLISELRMARRYMHGTSYLWTCTLVTKTDYESLLQGHHHSMGLKLRKHLSF